MKQSKAQPLAWPQQEKPSGELEAEEYDTNDAEAYMDAVTSGSHF